MKRRRRAFLVLAVAAAALTMLVVASEASGTSPQQFLGGVFGGANGSHTWPQQGTCCNMERPCLVGPNLSVPSYCCWCGCYGSQPQAQPSQQWFPCVAWGCSHPTCCGYCYPTPCTKVCPMQPAAASTG